MKYLFFFLLTISSLAAIAQPSPVEKAISKYDGKKGVHVQDLSPGTETWDKMMKEKNGTLHDLLEQLETLKVIKCDPESASLATCNKFYDRLSEATKDSRYFGILEVTDDDGEHVGMYMNKLDDGSLHEAVLLVEEDESFLLVYLKGTIDISKINLGEIMNALSCKSGKKACR